jgi:plastocyanin
VFSALLGAGVCVLPTIAGGSEPPPAIAAVNGSTHYWSPATATVGENGVITISNPTEVNHGVEWVSGPTTPSCSGVPVGNTPAASGKKWSGTCTFAKPGVYRFYCTVHGPEMTGTVTVNANGTTTMTMTMGSTETTSTTTTTTPTASTPAGSTAPQTPISGTPGTSFPGGPGAGSSLLAGSASSAVKVPASQRGRAVHGAIDVSDTGAGARLEVQLLATHASLASVTRQSPVRVGRIVHATLPAGATSFTVALSAAGAHALRLHGHLALSVKILLTPVHGTALAITRSVLMRR